MALLWQGQIASTGETGESRTIYGYIYGDWSRTDNTVTISNVSVQHRADLNPTYWDWEWQADIDIHGVRVATDAQTKGRTGGSNVFNVTYGTGNYSRAFSVGTGGGTVNVDANWSSNYYGANAGMQAGPISFAAAGSPSGTTGAPSSITTTSVQIRNDVTSWGDYCTAGSVRSYRATNSGFSDQTYIATTDNALVTHTGLTSNDEYWFRGWMDNGAGLSNYMGSTRTAVTLPLAPVASTPTTITSARVVIPTTINTGGGRYTITKKYRIKETAGAYGAWTTYTGDDISITNLSPNTSYTVEVESITTSGTTVGGTTVFTTKKVSGNFLPMFVR